MDVLNECRPNMVLYIDVTGQQLDEIRIAKIRSDTFDAITETQANTFFDMYPVTHKWTGSEGTFFTKTNLRNDVFYRGVTRWIEGIRSDLILEGETWKFAVLISEVIASS